MATTQDGCQRSYWLAGIFIILLLYTFYFARTLLLPILLALLLSLVLSPLVRLLGMLRIPAALGAAMVLLGLLGVVGQGLYLLLDPATEWLEKAPSSFEEVEWRLRRLQNDGGVLEEVHEATQQVEELAELGTERPVQEPVQVEVTAPSFTETLLSSTPKVLGGIGVGIILLYFLLASGDTFLRKLVRVVPTMEDKRRAVEIARRIQHDISLYLLTIAVINTALGVAVGTAMYFLKMPNPLLWGVIVAALNFAPYLGAMISFSILSVVSLLTFQDLSQAALPPAVFLALTSLEGQILTPWVLGRRLSLNPLVVFINITIWGWLWGIPGLLIAVPMLAVVKIVCDEVDYLKYISEFLGD